MHFILENFQLALYVIAIIVLSLLSSKKGGGIFRYIPASFLRFFSAASPTKAPSASVGYASASARDQEAMQALAGRDLPQYMKDRIASQKQNQFAWTSNLSVSDFLLLKQYDLKPLGMVMGAAHYQLGFSIADHIRQIKGRGINSFGFSAVTSYELRDYSDAIRDTFELALSRMQLEAKLMGANAVVNVAIKPVFPSVYDHDFEFEVTGTAVALQNASLPHQPIMTTVNLVEFVKLIAAGSLPVGCAVGVGIYFDATSYTGKWQQTFYSKNAELTEYSQKIYRVRNIALSHLEANVTRLGGSGVLGYRNEFKVNEFEVEHSENDSRKDHVLQYIILGTVLDNKKGFRLTNPVRMAVNFAT